MRTFSLFFHEQVTVSGRDPRLRSLSAFRKVLKRTPERSTLTLLATEPASVPRWRRKPAPCVDKNPRRASTRSWWEGSNGESNVTSHKATERRRRGWNMHVMLRSSNLRILFDSVNNLASFTRSKWKQMRGAYFRRNLAAGLGVGMFNRKRWTLLNVFTPRLIREWLPSWIGNWR